MEAKAVARYIRTSPRKVRLVIDAIRGKNVEDALNILSFTPKRAAKIVYKLLRSAIANAENLKMDRAALFIGSIFVDQGPTLKRWRAKAMGRAGMIRKRTSHITVILKEREE